MTRAAIRGPRGQMAPPGAVGAPASAFSPTRGQANSPPPCSSLFLSLSRTLNLLISNRCARSGSGPHDCYLLLRPVTTAVTRKSLYSYGSRALLPSYRQNGAIHVQVSAHARTPQSIYLYGNIGNNRYCLSISRACALLSQLPASARLGNSVTLSLRAVVAFPWPNKIEGGYSIVGAEMAAQHRPAGDARRNFRAPIAAGELELGLDLVDRQRIQLLGRNGGKLRFLGGRSGVVGTMLLERSKQEVEFARQSSTPHKLCQQAPQPQRWACTTRQGGTPPIAIASSPCLLALDVDRISIRPSLGRPVRFSGRPLTWITRNGLGVSGLDFAGSPQRRGAEGYRNDRYRVGDGSASGFGWQSELQARLAWEAVHVNG